MILTPDRRLRVFVSSTLNELADERAAVRAAIERLHLTPVLFELGARPHPPRTLYRAYLEQSDIFIGIYAVSYGWIAPDMEVSGLEDEYRLSSGMPRLVYVKNGAERDPRLEELLASIQADLSYRYFSSPAELAELVQNDLVVLLTERFHGTEETPRDERLTLPAQLSAFVGRAPELERLEERLVDPTVRIVTLTGPGGIGKTRLSLEAAERVRDRYEHGAYFVSLASLRDPQLVPEAMARALNVHSSGETNPFDDVRDFLADKRCLLILDNFEHLLDAATVVSDLVGACENVTILATSRSPLHIRGEHVYDVPPLEIPREREDRDALERYDAIRLFVDRAAAVRGDFVMTDENAPTIAEICNRLDGLPLAIELAASRIRVFSPETLLKRLGSRFKLLAGGSRDMPERHQTLRDAIAWSYDLLDEDAKRLFAWLGSFRGGFTLASVEEICSDRLDVLEAMSDLIDQSLVRQDNARDGEPRLMMLETIREFAVETLSESLDREEIVMRHADHYIDVALATRDMIGTARQREVMERLDADLDNLRAATRTLLENGQADRVADMLLGTWQFWWTRAHIRDGRRWGERVLAREADLSPLGRARALAFHSAMSFWQGDYNAALPGFVEAAQIFEQQEDKAGIAITDLALGLVQGFLGDFEAGSERIDRGRRLYEEMGDSFGIVGALNALGWLQATFGRFDESDEMIRRAIEIAQELESQADVGLAQINLARWLLRHERVDEAIAELRSSLDLLSSLRHHGATANVIDIVVEVAAVRRDWEGVLTLAGAAETIRGRLGAENPQPGAERLAEVAAQARAQLPADVADRAWAAGCALDLDGSVDAARSLLGVADRAAQPA